MSQTRPVSSPPQLVFLTFDGAITSTNYYNFTYILGSRVNPNKCPITMTFFTTHKSNDYTYTHDLYYRGNEMAAKSVTDKTPSNLWSNMTTAESFDEIGGVRDMINIYANIPKSSVKGYRAPYIETNGDSTMAALKSIGLTYDASYVSKMDNSPIWPYTMDYGFTQDCQSPSNNCPTASYPGLWNVPMVVMTSMDGSMKCGMADACTPEPKDASSAFNFLKSNFLNSYNTNRAPFGIYLHSAWFQSSPWNLEGYTQFVDYVLQLQDVYIVSVSQGIEYMKNPVPASQAVNSTAFSCPKVSPSSCSPRKCYYNDDDGNDVVMSSCVVCPNNYPWVGNPQGN
jgi:hypothetical protein